MFNRNIPAKIRENGFCRRCENSMHAGSAENTAVVCDDRHLQDLKPHDHFKRTSSMFRIMAINGNNVFYGRILLSVDSTIKKLSHLCAIVLSNVLAILRSCDLTPLDFFLKGDGDQFNENDDSQQFRLSSLPRSKQNIDGGKHAR